MALIDEIESKSKEIITDNYSMSVGELISMYKDGDLEIHPEFQRFYRWSISQKSRLIESFLLNFPVPPIFVYQRTDGVWDVVDGLQRISTILQFVGEYKDENGNKLEPLVLEATKMLPSLEGKKYQDENEASSLTDIERRYFKKSRLNIIILKKESDATGQYEVFQRLNTGGTPLSPQEVRNCLMVMTKRDIFQKLVALSQYPSFKSTLDLNEKALQERYDMELVTRFICLRHENVERFKNVIDFSEYLNDKIIELFNQEINWEQEEDIFRNTFDAINAALGDEAFCKYDSNKQKFKGAFYIPAFEFIAITIGRHDGKIERSHLKDRVIAIWNKITKDNITWQGRNHRVRIKETLELGEMLYVG